MKTFNELNLDEIKVGEKVSFLYESSSKKPTEHTEEQVKIKIKSEVFQAAVNKIIDGYDKKIEHINKLSIDLKEQYDALAKIKGKYDKNSKLIREHVQGKIEEYFHSNSSEQSHDSSGVVNLFFKQYTKKETMLPENCHEVTVYYGGKTIDTRNGRVYDYFVTDTGYISMNQFNPALHERI